MAERGNVTAREVLIELRAHIEACVAWNKIHIAFIGAVMAVLVSFAGYTYVHNQYLADQLEKTRDAEIRAVAQVPAKTAQAITATNPPSN